MKAAFIEATGKSFELEKAADMFKKILSEKIHKKFNAAWDDMDLSPRLEELKAAKESAVSNEKQKRPSDVEVEDQVRVVVFKKLMKRKQILEGQIKYQNQLLEENLVPSIEEARAELRGKMHRRQSILSKIDDDEENIKRIEQKLKEVQTKDL